MVDGSSGLPGDYALYRLILKLKKLEPRLRRKAADLVCELKPQYPERKFYCEAHSVWAQLGGRGQYFRFIKRLADIVRILDVDKECVHRAVNGRGKSGDC
jgi:hypothetical protein